MDIVRNELAEMIRKIESEHDYSSLILNGLVYDEECQRVIEFINNHPNASFNDVISFSFSIEIERYNLEHVDDGYISPYAATVKSFFSRRFPSYPDLTIESLELSFQIRSATKNTPLIYTILERLPENTYSININSVLVTIDNEIDITKQLELISDLISIIKKWKSTTLKLNNTVLDVGKNEFCFIIDFLKQKHNISGWYQTNDISYIEKKYHPPKRKKSRVEYPEQIQRLSKTNLTYSLTIVAEKYIELFGNNFTVNYYDITQQDKVVVIENNLVVDFRLIPKPFSWENNTVDDWEYPVIVIQ